MKCGCDAMAAELRPYNFRLHRRDYYDYPLPDFIFGCPTPTTPFYFEAIDPNAMPLRCRHCHELVKIQSGGGALQRTPSALQRVQFMFVPRIVRQVFLLLWVARHHGNLKHTLLLQLKYLCDVYLSYAFVVGRFEVNMDDGPAMPLPLSGCLAGLISGVVSLVRAYLAPM